MDQPAVRRLEEFLAAETGESLELTAFKPFSGGRSAATSLLRLVINGEPADYVLRVEVEGGPLDGISDLSRQYRLLSAIADEPVPSPVPRWFSDDPTILGASFAVFEHLPGSVPNPWRPEGRRELVEQAATGELAESYVQTMVAIHRIPVERLPADSGAGDPGAAADHIERELARWRRAVGDMEMFRIDPVVAYAECWLTANAPDPMPPALIHGDYRPGNIVIGDHAVTGVLDWELAEVGDPRYDVGIACSSPVLTDGKAAGLWEPAALVARYSEIAGTELDPIAVRAFAVLSTYRIVLQWVNAARKFTVGKDDLEALRAGYSALESRPHLAHDLGLVVPKVGAGDESAARAARTLRDELKAAVLPDVEGVGRERLILAMAVLRSQSSAAATGVRLEFESRLGRFCDATGTGEIADPVTSNVHARFTSTVRRLMADDEFAQDPSRPDHAEMRELIGISASPALGNWP